MRALCGSGGGIAGFDVARYKQPMAACPDRAAARRIVLAGPESTAALAARLARVARAGDVIALSGALGAGKTVFARGFVVAVAAARGGTVDEVPSPTFTLVQSYAFDDLTVFHFDLYRMARPDDAWELGIEDAFVDGVTLIEWPDRLGALLPEDRLDVELLPGNGPEGRIALLTPRGGWRSRLEAALADG